MAKRKHRMSRRKKRMLVWTLVLLLAALLPVGLRFLRTALAENREPGVLLSSGLSADSLPPYGGEVSVSLQEENTGLSPTALPPEPFILLSELDALGRTGPALAVIGPESLPTAPRGEIGDVRPAGFQNVRYDDLIEDHYLYNRCHLIAYQLSGINADPRILFTGTRYLNVEGMLPWENAVASFVRRVGCHVLYRVTPLYMSGELLPRYVELEAVSMEDGGRGLRFHVLVYNVQPGIVINYRDGSSRRDDSS